MEYLAHSPNAAGQVHPLKDHLRETAELAARFASAFGAAEEARIAGLLHDLGKYGDLFQLRLQGKAQGVDHWTLGAVAALEALKVEGVAVALAIYGHHVGLQQASLDALRSLFPEQWPQGHPQNRRLSDPEGDRGRLLSRFAGDGLTLPSSLERTGYAGLDGPPAAAMLDVRMLYSALVDADYLDTERHFQTARTPGPELEPARAFELLMGALARLREGSQAAPGVQQLRDDLLDACTTAAEYSPGLFTLTAPTGAGKTLSMLAFALRHAALHQLRRVVVVIPYLTIIEQTVGAYRKALEEVGEGALDQFILEDHSLAGLSQDTNPEDDDRDPRRLLAENWDAPIVVTTSVQFLESLFAARSSACRKLHRLARSVILFDEVQTLPTRLAVPTLATLSHLAEGYGASVVFSTATQPAFSHLNDRVRGLCPRGWEPREIVPTQAALFERSRRVRVEWPDDPAPPTPWAELADALAGHRQALCVVNLKRHAWALLDELKARGVAGLAHLSTSMCPAHRHQTLTEVRRRLEQGEPCLLVSTQCVEAGVDVDFPVAYRAWGPLDAIAQVAGRCNRNGKLEMGTVVVFRPEDPNAYPDSTYGQAAAATEALLRQRGRERMDITDPELHTAYYRRLYDLQGIPKARDDKDPLVEYLLSQHFAEVARRYRLIQQDAINVLTPYCPMGFQQLAAEAREAGLTRSWVARARPLTVSLFRPRSDSPIWSRLEAVRCKGSHETTHDWYISLMGEDYDKKKGLMPQQDPGVQIA